MPEATLSSKYQVTLPMDIVRMLGLKGGDKLVVTLVEDHVVLMRKPANWAAWANGRLKGVYGTTVEAVDHYIREERAGWEPSERMATLRALLASDPLARAVYRALSQRPQDRRGLEESLGRPEGLDQVLRKLLEMGAIQADPATNAPGLGDQLLYMVV